MSGTGGLRDALLASLKSLAGTRNFHLHVLVSSPQKHKSLFPYASPLPRTFLQHVLVLLSEQQPGTEVNAAPHIFVSAIEAMVYIVPSTSTAILYIAKVDSTGQAMAPSPTSTLVRAFLRYYVDPVTRPIAANQIWIHIFARAQNQYLFPNSSEFPGKQWLSDIRLCAWWKRQLSEVVQSTQTSGAAFSSSKCGLYYLLPGLSELEALNTIQRAGGSFSGTISSSTPQWKYGHPYSDPTHPFPCAPPKEGQNLGHLIPWFDDDPKSRFLDEIACTTEIDNMKSPERKRRRLTDHLAAEDRPTESEEDGADKRRGEHDATAKGKERTSGTGAEDHRPQGELAKVTVDEFWERMSFRQECVSGAITGFFVLVVSTPASLSVTPQAPPGVPQQLGQVSADLVKRVLTSLMTGNEFSSTERAIRSTETIENAIRGLCDDGGAAAGTTSLSSEARAPSSATAAPDAARPPTPEPSEADGTLAPRTPPRRLAPGSRRNLQSDISPNPFPDPIPTLETYAAHIYGSVKVDNPPAPPRQNASGPNSIAPEPAKVTVLTARKKKKPAS